MILEDLLDRLEDIEVSDTYLYFITRVLKHNQKKIAKFWINIFLKYIKLI